MPERSARGEDHLALEELAADAAREKPPDAEGAGARGIGHRPLLEEADGVTPATSSTRRH